MRHDRVVLIITVLGLTLTSLGFRPIPSLLNNRNTGITFLNLFSYHDATSASSTKAPYATGCAGTTWYDLTSNAKNASVAICGTGWTGAGTAASPYAFTFNGTSSQLTAGTLLSGYSRAAIEAWVKPASASATGTVIAGNAGASGNGMVLRQSISPPGRYELVVGQGLNTSRDYRNLVKSYSPVGYWRLGESSGTSVADLSVTGNNGTYTGVTLSQAGAISGDPNTAVTFTGSSSSYLEIPSHSAYDLTTGSVAFWFKTSTGTGMLFGRHDAASSFNGVNLFVGGTGAVSLQIKSATLQTGVSTAAGFNNGSWHLVVLNFSQANGGTNRIYVDGISAASFTNSFAWNFNNQVIRVSRSLDSFWSNFSGEIDELAIFPAQLTQAQITALYTNTGQTYSNFIVAESPVAYYHFNETSGTTATDVMGTKNLTYGSSVTLNSVANGVKGSESNAPLFPGGASGIGMASAGSIPAALVLMGAMSIEAWVRVPSIGTEIPIFRSGNPGLYVTSSGTLTFQQNTVSNGFVNITASTVLSANQWYHVVLTRDVATTGVVFYLIWVFTSCGLELDQDNSGTNYFALGTVNALSSGTWHHCVATRSGATIKIYADGVINNSGSGAGTVNLTNTTSVYVGRQTNPVSYYTGSLGPIRMYNRALAPAEVKKNCLAQEARFTSTSQSICGAP